MTKHTHIRGTFGHDHDGKWSARDTYKVDALPRDNRLEIRSSKNNRGELVAHASLMWVEGDSMTHMLFQDFAQCVLREPAKRVTYGVLRSFHARALTSIDATVERVIAFYAGKADKAA